jgi:predicted dehydrogenase/acetyltransferase-like isoleucine patch superfamily enzyme
VRVFDKLGALHAVCDTVPGRLTSLGLSSAVRRYGGLDEVLADPAVGSVVIATPAATHYEVCRAALTAGKDVFVEKPLALEVKQGEELVALAEQRDRILMVGHILRYHPAVLKLGEMIEAGSLGRVEYVYSNRLNMGKLRTEENILWSFAPHDISVILALLGEQPLSVSSHGEAFLQRNISDVTLTSIEFPNNVKAHTFVSWLHPFKEQRLVVVGSEQMAVFEDTSPTEKLVTYPHKVEWHAGKTPVAVKGERQVVEIPASEPLQVECEHFLECCLDRIPARTDGREGLAVLRVLAAAEESLRQGGRMVNVARPGGNGHRSPQRTKSEVRMQKSECRTAEPEVRHRRNAEVRIAEGPLRLANAAGDGMVTMIAAPSATRTGAAVRTRAEVRMQKSECRTAATEVGPQTRAFVHPTAVVDEGVEIGGGTKVWHWSHVSKNTSIGRNNVFGQNVFVADNVKTGDNCKVQNNVSLYKGVVLEDDVFCGPSCVFTNVIDPRAFIEKKAEFKSTLVKRGASIGANATVVCGNTLGRYCLIGSGAVVTHDVPDYALVAGVPARRRGWVCKCGARLQLAATAPVGQRSGDRTVCKCGNEYELSDGAVRPVLER